MGTTTVLTSAAAGEVAGIRMGTVMGYVEWVFDVDKMCVCVCLFCLVEV